MCPFEHASYHREVAASSFHADAKAYRSGDIACFGTIPTQLLIDQFDVVPFDQLSHLDQLPHLDQSSHLDQLSHLTYGQEEERSVQSQWAACCAGMCVVPFCIVQLVIVDSIVI